MDLRLEKQEKKHNQIIWQILFNNLNFLLLVLMWIQKINVLYIQWKGINPISASVALI